MDREQRYPVSVGSSDPLFSEDEFRRAHELRDAGKPLYEAQWQARSERVAALEAELEEAKRRASEMEHRYTKAKNRGDALKQQVEELQEAQGEAVRYLESYCEATDPDLRNDDGEEISVRSAYVLSAMLALAGSVEEQKP